MKKKLATLLITMISSISIGQSIVITELSVSDIKTNKYEDKFSDDTNNGPSVVVKFEIFNNDDKELVLDFKTSDVSLIFNFENEVFEVTPMWNFLPELDKVSIEANSKQKLSVSTFIFIGTKLYDENCLDYSNKLLRVLPTLKIKYKDDSGIRLMSSGIESVNIHSE